MIDSAFGSTKLDDLRDLIQERLSVEPGIARAIAIGTLESLWVFTRTQRPTGDVGSVSNWRLAEKMGWTHDPEWIINALVKTHWLDESKKHRLIVHDWSQHCNDYVHRTLIKHTQLFADDTIPRLTKINKSDRAEILARYSEVIENTVDKNLTPECANGRQNAPMGANGRSPNTTPNTTPHLTYTSPTPEFPLRENSLSQTTFAGDVSNTDDNWDLTDDPEPDPGYITDPDPEFDSEPDPPTEPSPEPPAPEPPADPKKPKRQFEATPEERAVAEHWHSTRQRWADEHAPGAYLPPGTISAKDYLAARTLMKGLSKRSPRDAVEHARDLIDWLHGVDDFWAPNVNTLLALARKLPDGKYYAKYAAWKMSGGGNGRCGTHRQVETRPEERHRAQFRGGVKI